MGEKPNKPLEILIVDDDDVLTRLHRFALEKLVESQVMIFGNGKEALEYLENSHFDIKKFLVLLDINMPVMNGWEFLETLQKKNYAKKVQVVILTSSSYKNDLLKSRKFRPVIGYYTKPLNKGNLVDILELNDSVSGDIEKRAVRKT